MHLEGLTIIDDSYNSNPLSFKSAIMALADMPANGRRIVVCADMLELGKDSDRLHFEAGQFVARQGIDLLLVFGDKADCVRDGAIDGKMGRDKIYLFKEKSRIAEFLKNNTGYNDIILVKGSRGMRMEEVVECFTTCFTH